MVKKLSISGVRRIGKPMIILIIMAFVGLFSAQLATDLPWYVKYRGEVWFPAFSVILNPNKTVNLSETSGNPGGIVQVDLVDWKQLKTESIVFAPIPWAADKPDILNRDFTGPFDKQKFKTIEGRITEMPWRFRHWLGTDSMGNDLLAGIIKGTGLSLWLGFSAMILAGIIGIILGSLAGFFGDHRMHLTRGVWFGGVFGFLLGIFWTFVSRFFDWLDASSIGVGATAMEILIGGLTITLSAIGFGFIGRVFQWIPYLRKKKAIPVDMLIRRFSEVFNSIPGLVIIVTLAALFREKSTAMVIGIIGLTSWPGVYRFCRAEMFRVREMTFIEAAKSYGLPEWKILFRHALPHTLSPVITELAFLVSTAIIIESSLSFLGIGVPDEAITWGSLLSTGRQYFDAWWMVLFPGLAIFATVFSFNLIGDRLKESFHKKS